MYLAAGVAVLFVVAFIFVYLHLLGVYGGYAKAHGKHFPFPTAWEGGPGRRHGQPNASDIQSIQSWMTFSYINHIFNLPNDYLKTELNISSTQYPNITIAKVIASQSLATNDFLTNMRGLIQTFLVSRTPTSGTWSPQ